MVSNSLSGGANAIVRQPLHEQLLQLREARIALTKSHSALIERLGAVLLPPTPEATGTDRGERTMPCECALRTVVREEIEAIESMTRGIYRLIENIDL
jgi:hypothetical protein